MARNVGGFAEGFKGGFGLVNDFNAQKAKERDAEQTQEFRQEELGLRKQVAKDKAEQDLLQTGFQKTAAEEATRRRLLAEDERKARIIRDEAAGVSRDARDASADAVNLARLDGIALTNKVNQGEIDAQNKVADEREVEALNLRVGTIYSNLQSLGEGGDFEGMRKLIEANRADLTNPLGSLNYLDIVNPETGINLAALGEDMKKLSGGALDKASPGTLALMDVVLNKERSAIVGQDITSEFVNAPSAWHDQGYKVLATGISNIQSNVDGSGTADSWVKVLSPEGDIAFYPAGTTQKGEPGVVTKQEMNLDEGMQALAGYAQFYQFMNKNPLIKAAIEEREKIEKFGTLEKFESAVTAEVNKVFADIGQAEEDFIPESVKELGLGVGGVAATRQEVRQKIQQNFLYGPPKVKNNKEAEAYFEDVRNRFSQISARQTKGNPFGRYGNRSITSFVPEGTEFSLKQMLSINHMADDKGIINDPEALNAYLQKQDDTWGQ